MGKILNITGGILVAVLLFSSCSESSCTESTVADASAQFYTKSPHAALTFDSISVKGIGQISDSMLLNKSKKVKSLSLPLRIKSDTTAFEIRFYRSNSATLDKTDTVRFFHQVRPQYLSPDCGCSVFYHIDSVAYTHHRIDTIKIKQPEITNQNEEHLQILF